jgi:hypothetical protein
MTERKVKSLREKVFCELLKHKIKKCEFRGFSKSIMFEIKSDSMI